MPKSSRGRSCKPFSASTADSGKKSHGRKAKTSGDPLPELDIPDVHNVYEFQERLDKTRSHVTKSVTRSERQLVGVSDRDSDSGDDDRLDNIGNVDVEGVVEEDDDEEIESDESVDDGDDDGSMSAQPFGLYTTGAASDLPDEEIDWDGDDEDLEHFIDDLPIRPVDDHAKEDMTPQRHFLAERTEVLPEGDFGAPSSSTKLTADDLISTLRTASSNTQAVISFKSSLKALTSTENAPLPAPLPLRTQDRIDRKVAYDKTKEEVAKWVPTMQRLTKAEHLSFPLQVSTPARATTTALVGSFEPSNNLENAIDRLLKGAHPNTPEVVEGEDQLPPAKELTIQEIKQRQAELRRSRELMDRAQVKATRMAKIKSKTFRKLLRREKAKHTTNAEDLAALNPEAAEAEKMRQETDRAKERATLRHKNGSKWVKTSKAMQGNMDRRKSVQEMLQRSEALRQKISGVVGSDSGSDDSEEDAEEIVRRAAAEMVSLRNDDDVTEGSSKGVWSMKFMKDATSRQMDKVRQESDDFLRELGGGVDDDVGDENALPPGSMSLRVGGNRGRLVFHPHDPRVTSQRGPALSVQNESDTSPFETENREDSPVIELRRSTSKVSILRQPSPAPMTSNPWLAVGAEAKSGKRKASQKHNGVVVDKNSRSFVKSTAKLDKRLKALQTSSEKIIDEDTVVISLEDVLTRPKSDDAPQIFGIKNKNKKRRRSPDSDKSGPSKISKQLKVDAAYETSEDEPDTAEPSASLPIVRQRDLVSQAFAGDNVVEEFEALKEQEIERDQPKEINTALPGWGSWVGQGLKAKTPSERFLKKTKGVDATSRKDHGKKHVVISELKDTKAEKFRVKDIPFPYTSKAQYEKSLDTPLGTEWNTRIGHQRVVLPRVTTKIGTVITPLEKLF